MTVDRLDGSRMSLKAVSLTCMLDAYMQRRWAEAAIRFSATSSRSTLTEAACPLITTGCWPSMSLDHDRDVDVRVDHSFETWQSNDLDGKSKRCVGVREAELGLHRG